MKVFITGGTGFIGSAVIDELSKFDYEMIGLARSKRSAEKLRSKGVTPLMGSLTDLNVLRKGTQEADAILHLAFGHNFRHFLKATKDDRKAIRTMADAIKGTNKTFIITSGITSIYAKNQQGKELERPKTNVISGLRVRSERLLLSYTDKGIRTMVVRLPPAVHGESDHGFAWNFIQNAIKNQEVNYVGKGLNQWAAVNRLDAALVYRLALENGKSGSIYHAVSEVVNFKEIACKISKKLNLPLVSISRLKAYQKFPPSLSAIISSNTPANSDWTQKELNWHPIYSDLIKDLDLESYYQK